jgi:DNA polymerase-3 subunit beta
MKLKIDRALFLKSLTHAQSIVERRTTVPILSHVMLSTKDQTLTLTATDLDLSFTQTLEAHVEKSGTLTVSAHMLYDIVRKLSAKEPLSLDLNIQNQQLTLTSGKSEFILSTLSHEEFPIFQQDTLPCTFELPSATLRKLIDATRFAMAVEETRYYLNGLYWHACDETHKLRIVATDGHRLARSQTDLPTQASGMPGVILSRKTVGEIRKIIDELDGSISIGLSESQMRFAFGNTTLTSRLIDGTFPDYQKVIPEANDRILSMNTKDFAQAVDRVSIITSERSRAIKLSLRDNLLVLAAVSSENGSAREELAVSYTYEPLDIGFNAKYVLDVTNHLVGDEVKFLLSDSTAPVIIHDQGDMDNLFVLMPMRV